ncbi:SipW-dependent-type signal peptide-containing protein [Arthrobacter sp. zg-Y750]|uniref:SipW-dependent-type signal peptide-containing protein n=1 Tax=Arthrobacter sp. zg-Y750 TaxID=2894189 RepID=UPI002F3F3828|nr:SipW-dependent-type signal peptide-containing protein [Arthrobacter sp. zg-Y750]
MKSLRALKGAGLVLAAVVLGLMTVQGSYALWNASVEVNAGTIQAADFNVLINDANMADTPALALNPGELKRGTSAYQSVRVTNAVNVQPGSPLVLQPAVGLPAPGTLLEGNLTVTARVLKAGQTCSAPLDVPPGTPQLQTLGTGATQTLCFKITLSTSTPARLLGTPVSIPVNLSVAQLAPTAK